MRAMIVWNKGVPGMGRGWRSTHELIAHGVNRVMEYDNTAAQPNVLTQRRLPNRYHMTQKPVALIRALLTPHVNLRRVYDPFAGSGSVAVAAHGLGIASLSMEIVPENAAIAVARLAAATGATARKVDA